MSFGLCEGVTHFLFALLLGKLLKLDIKGVVLASIFSLLPDIDMPNSAIGKITKKFSMKVYEKFGHRTFTHSAIFASLILTPFYICGNFLPPFIGLISHLTLDMLTFTGVQLLWPYEKNFVIIGKMKSGGSADKVLSLIFLFMLWWVD